MKVSKIISVLSWSLYDFANTIFAMNVISLHFALWVVKDKGGQNLYYSIAIAISLFLVALTMPILGALSDRFILKKSFLTLFTLICVGFTIMIGFAKSLFTGLLFFVIANFGYQQGGLFYTTLLPRVSNARNIGRVSGLGVALGYLGTILGMAFVHPFVLKGGRQAAFLPTGLLFLAFALPCLIFVKKEGSPAKKPKQAYFNLRDYPGFKQVLIAFFICLSVINTVIIFMGVYISEVAKFTYPEIFKFLLISTTFAIIASVIAGFMTDKKGARDIIIKAVGMWCLLLFLAALGFNKIFFWFLGPLAGICLGPTWVASRPLIIQFSPPEKLGQFLGLFGFVAIFSTIIGPNIWGLIVWAFEFTGDFKYRIAAFVFFIFMLFGFKYIKRIPPTFKK